MVNLSSNHLFILALFIDVQNKSIKRPWTSQEKAAVQRNMSKFISLRRVPAKYDCQICIEKESPVLCSRTWKDVKYFVYNQIVKIKRKVAI